MLSVTKADILSFSPCASESLDQIDSLMAGHDSVDASYILTVPIPTDHKLWLLLRPELLTREQLLSIDESFKTRLGRSLNLNPLVDMQPYIPALIRKYREEGKTDEDSYAFMLTIVEAVCG